MSQNKKRPSRVRAISGNSRLYSSHERDAVRKKSPKNSDSAAAAQKQEDLGVGFAAAQQPTQLNIRKPLPKRENRSRSVDSVPHSLFKSWSDDLPKLKQTSSPRRGKKFAASVESLPDPQSQKCYLPADSKGKVTGPLFCLQPPLYPGMMSSVESIRFGIPSDSNSDDDLLNIESPPRSPQRPRAQSQPTSTLRVKYDSDSDSSGGYKKKKRKRKTKKRKKRRFKKTKKGKKRRRKTRKSRYKSKRKTKRKK